LGPPPCYPGWPAASCTCNGLWLLSHIAESKFLTTFQRIFREKSEEMFWKICPRCNYIPPRASSADEPRFFPLQIFGPDLFLIILFSPFPVDAVFILATPPATLLKQARQICSTLSNLKY
jgi:hypothetical protein